MKKASFAGQFYSSNSNELENNIKEMLKDAGKPLNRVFGIISPHAGYAYSGKAAAFSYKSIYKQKFDTFVILGTNHSERGIGISDEDFETPLGIIKTDKEFVRLLKKDFGQEFPSYEHSIEVQLPFIQHLFKAKIVPIAVSSDSYSECSRLAESIYDASKRLKRKICVVASGDFTHYGEDYDFTDKKPSEIDPVAIKLIEKMDSKKFFEFSENLTICGSSAITVCIELCKKLGSKGAKLLKYYNSGDVSKDYRNIVGYASMAFI